MNDSARMIEVLMKYLTVDPGTTQSAYCGMREDYSLITAAKVDNDKLMQLINLGGYDALVIECMEARTLNVKKLKPGERPLPPQKIGDETYETCIWIGRFMEAAIRRNMVVYRVGRSEERKRLIPSKKNGLEPLPEPVPKSVDAQIRLSLIRRFAKHDKVTGKGKKASPDVFYGFKTDMWNAFAVGVVHLDKTQEGG